MLTETEIDENYLNQANLLETEFFDIVNNGLPSQHRELKASKSQTDFTNQHTLIWHNHEAELIASGYLVPRPEPTPPASGHPAQLVSVDALAARPARVKRTWNGQDWFYDCLVTESVITKYQAGEIVIGDYLWVEFVDTSEEIGGGEQIVIGKIRKTW